MARASASSRRHSSRVGSTVWSSCRRAAIIPTWSRSAMQVWP
jgi:hypothetical protein